MTQWHLDHHTQKRLDSGILIELRNPELIILPDTERKRLSYRKLPYRTPLLSALLWLWKIQMRLQSMSQTKSLSKKLWMIVLLIEML